LCSAALSVELRRCSIAGRIRTCNHRIRRSNPNLHHATNSANLFVTSLLHCFLTSYAHTRSVFTAGSFQLAKETRRKIPGGINAHGPWDSNPKPCGFFQTKYPRTTPSRETISRQISLDRNDLGGDFRLAQTSRARDWSALASFRRGFYLLVSFVLLFTLSEVPKKGLYS